MKRVFLFLGLIAVLALSACAAPISPTQMAPQPAAPVQQTVGQPAPAVRTISVTGTGQVTLSPDVAYVYIGVHSQSENVADALSENNAKSQTVAGALKELNIDPKDIQTSNFNISPQSQYGPQGEITSTTYNVDNSVFVTVRDLQVLGKLLDVAVRSGANSINGITFDVLDKTQATSDARKLAIESARSQAEEMAQAAGVTLGQVQQMNVYTSTPPIPMFEGKSAASGSAQVPVSAGQMVIRVEVSTVYAIQ